MAACSWRRSARASQRGERNQGDARSGLGHTEAVESTIRVALNEFRTANPDAPRLAVNTIKRSGVDIAELLGNLLATFFLVFGLFSIGHSHPLEGR